MATTTTGRDDAWFNELSITDLLKVLNAAAELNFSEEIRKNGRGLADQIKGIFQPKTVKLPSPAPSTSS